MTIAEGRIREPRTEPVEMCPICNCGDSRFFFAAPDRLHGIPGEYRYSRCNSCKTVFQNPVVVQEDIAVLYPQNYYTHRPNSQPGAIKTFESLLTSKTGLKDRLRKSIIKSALGISEQGAVAKLGRLLAQSRLVRERAFFGLLMNELLPTGSGRMKALEIGCGSGRMLKTLGSVGWQVEGVEWDEQAARVAAESSGLNVHTGDVTTLDLEPQSYELILLHHVFEHLTRPVETLEEINRLLEVGGRAVLVYPNPQSLNAKMFQSFWYHWDPPRHLLFPRISSMRKLAIRLGFRISARTLSRIAAEGAAESRRYKRGSAVVGSAEIGSWDSLIKSAQNALIWFGFPVGEEVVVVLEKR